MAQHWRTELARRVADAYAADPAAAVVQIAGSVGRGNDDDYSDIEIDVYYCQPPTLAQRRASVARTGGVLLDLNEEVEEDEWAEEIDLGGLHVGTSTFLASTMEQYLAEVVDQAQLAPLAQVRLDLLAARRGGQGRRPCGAVARARRPLSRRPGRRNATGVPRL